jgi:hypothetical protein
VHLQAKIIRAWLHADGVWSVLLRPIGRVPPHRLLCRPPPKFGEGCRAGLAIQRKILSHKVSHVSFGRYAEAFCLLCQVRHCLAEGGFFGPVYSTLTDVDKPQTLTPPTPLFLKKPGNVDHWIDFWVICDDTHAYLRFLFQGCAAKERAGKKYSQFPWRLGLLEAERRP